MLGIGPLSRPLPLACSTKDWWWVPVVAPPLGAYLGAIIYLIDLVKWRETVKFFLVPLMPLGSSFSVSRDNITQFEGFQEKAQSWFFTLIHSGV